MAINSNSQGGRRPEKALTATFVRQVIKPGKYFDGHGLFLRVQPNGAKQWVQRIVIQGKRRELGLGAPPLVSLADARELAIENRKTARSGFDPLRSKREAAAILTFEEAARKVHEMHVPSWRNAKHAQDFINSLEMYAFPKIGARKTADVTTADVLGVLQPIWLEKPETARRVRQRIGSVMKWAIARGWRQDNPAENISKALPRQGKKVQAHRKALPYAEVSTCIDAIKASHAWGVTKLALEFLILTAARSGEVRFAAWTEIDLDSATWELPAERMKMKRPHRVPLSRRAVEILEGADRLRDSSGLVFPSVRGKPLSDMTLSKLVKELGFDADVHGFRTSFRTWAQEQTNYSREVAEAALAHAVGDSVEQAYARSDMFERRRKMMEAWAHYISARRGAVIRIA
ncbi:MAG: integrase [Alphaproteobacteria bacterium 64-11]|nr:MAG: integrase [Alphaproteobacteria bacterium 64-11]